MSYGATFIFNHTYRPSLLNCTGLLGCIAALRNIMPHTSGNVAEMGVVLLECRLFAMVAECESAAAVTCHHTSSPGHVKACFHYGCAAIVRDS